MREETLAIGGGVPHQSVAEPTSHIEFRLQKAQELIAKGAEETAPIHDCCSSQGLLPIVDDSDQQAILVDLVSDQAGSRLLARPTSAPVISAVSLAISVEDIGFSSVVMAVSFREWIVAPRAERPAALIA